jgi:hypothetical protein
MALQFNPPEWLIQEYMNRKQPAEVASEGIQNALSAYAALKQQQDLLGLKQQEAERQKQELAMKGKEAFYNYGDVSNLPAEVQSGLQNPVQGPVTEQGMSPSKGPIVDYFEQFRKQFPQGIKGHEKEQAPSKFQQVPVTMNGKPLRFNPQAGRYEVAPVVDSAAAGGTPENPTFLPRVLPPVPAAQSAELGDFQNILDQLKIVRDTKKPEIIGMLDSRAQDLRQLTGFGADPQAATFSAALGGIRNKLLNLLSGAAISPAEYQRLLQQLPDEKKGEVDFDAKLNAFEQNIQGVIANRQRSFQAAGYRQPVGGPINPTPSTVPSIGGTFNGAKVKNVTRIQ